MTQRLWQEELHASWPPAYWDEFMRRRDVRRDRACIRPEISRTYTFGYIGVSNGQFFNSYLRHNYLNQLPTAFNSTALSISLQPDTYDKEFLASVYDRSQVIRTPSQLLRLPEGPASFRYEYRTQTEFVEAARLLGAMQDFKEGIPRTAYRGVVPVFFLGKRIYLAPNATNRGRVQYPNWN